MNTDQFDNLYEIPVETIKGEKTTLKNYKNKVLLIVNLASKCGFTPQYKDLENLYRQYKDKEFVVLGFPCNQFLRQEPGTNKEIEEFATSCFNVTFPMFAKLNVRGKEQHPLYKFLKDNIKEKPKMQFIPWNFTKILVDKDGNVLRRYAPKTAMEDVEKDVVAIF